jgi:thioredoxin-like negative regulator of GroEL
MEANQNVLTDANFKKEVIQRHLPFVVEFTADWSGACHIVKPVRLRLMDE